MKVFRDRRCGKYGDRRVRDRGVEEDRSKRKLKIGDFILGNHHCSL
jgi:hypothetical protein